MVIIETSIFTKIIKALLSDDEYRELQKALIKVPTSGKIITGSGGIRKVRWRLQGRGKRGEQELFITGQLVKAKYLCFLLIQRMKWKT